MCMLAFVWLYVCMYAYVCLYPSMHEYNKKTLNVSTDESEWDVSVVFV